MGARDVALEGSAARLEQLIRQRGDYAHVHVQARAGHLVIRTQDSQGGQVIVARATPLGGMEYGLSFRSHTGRWEPMPVSGILEQIVDGVMDFLAPFVDPHVTQQEMKPPGEAQA